MTLTKPKQSKRRWLRRGLRWLSLGLLLAVLLLAALALSLKLRPVRAWVSGQVSGALESRTGLVLGLEDWSLGLLQGRVELIRPELRTPDGGRLFSADTVQATLELRSLLAGRRVLRSLVVTRPVLDPKVSLPPSEASGQTLDLDIQRFEIENGEISPLPADPQLVGLVDAWRVRDVELHGSYVGGQAEVELTRASILALGGKVDGLDLDLTTRLRGPADGPLELQSLVLQGPGLSFTVRGQIDLVPPRSTELAFELDADPRALFPELATQEDGYAQGRGRLHLTDLKDAAALAGELDLDMGAFPAEVLQPLLGPAVFRRLDGEQTHLDVTARLRVDPAAPESVQGEGSFLWCRGGDRILEGSVHTTGGKLDGSGRIDLKSLTGKGQVKAHDLPLEVLTKWIGEEGLSRTQVSGTDVDLTVDLTLDAQAADPSQALSALATVVWHRGDLRLLEASARTTRGPLDDSGRWDLQGLAYTASLETETLPVFVLEPWIGAAGLSQTWAAGTHLDVSAQLSMDLAAPEDSHGTAHVVWMQEDRRLVELSGQMGKGTEGKTWAKPQAPPGTLARPAGRAAGAEISFHATLLPASAGQRQVTGKLQADPGRWSGWRLAETRVDLQVPDTAEAIAELEALWPQVRVAGAKDLALDGTFAATAELQGEVLDPDIVTLMTWKPTADSALRLWVRGRTGDRDGEAHLRVENFDLTRLGPGLAGNVSGTVSVWGSPRTYLAQLQLDATQLDLGEGAFGLDHVHLDAETDGHEWRVRSLSGAAGKATFEGDGEFDLSRPPRHGALRLALVQPMEGIHRVDLSGVVDEGVLVIETEEFHSDAGTCLIEATVPLAALPASQGMENLLMGGTGDREEGTSKAPPITLRLHLPEVDSHTLAPLFGRREPTHRLRARGVRLALRLDARDPTASSGSLDLAHARLDRGDQVMELRQPLKLRLSNRRLDLGEPVLLSQAGELRMGGSLALNPEWRWDGPAQDLLASLSLTGHGPVDASLLNPYLGGGSATGPISTRFALAGRPLDDLEGEVHFEGPQTTLYYLFPYVTKIEQPVVDLAVGGGEVKVSRGQARLNEGRVELTGSYRRNRELDLSARFHQVRYRLDYGLSATLSGELQGTFPLPVAGETGTPAARSRIEGRLLLEQGLVRRDIDLEQEILGALFAPADLTGTGETTAQAVDLDVSLATQGGVRVKNNVADLRALWSPLLVRGTLAEPLIQGRIEAEAGGLLFAYGQTLRLDEATVTLSGQPGVEPQFDLSTTSWIEDPTLADRNGIGPLHRLAQPAGTVEDANAAVEAGLKGYLGAKIASTLGESVGITGLNVRPAVVLGESDPDARFTVSQDLTLNLALAVAIDMRNAERRTYLLDVHDFRPLPGLAAQVFNNEDDNNGVTVQHTMNFGGSGKDESQVRVEEVRVHPPGFESRSLKAALGLGEGNRLVQVAGRQADQAHEAEALFDAEVEIIELLRKQGYADARVSVRRQPSERGEGFVDLEVRIDPGPQAKFRFEGDLPPEESRDSIVALYRSDFYEPASRLEMQRQTVRALRSLGFVDPEVEITILHGGDGFPPAPHQVVIRSQGGRRLESTAVRFNGVGAEEAEVLLNRFSGPVERMELAAGLATADRRLLASLRSLGYPQATLTGRELGSGTGGVTVDLDLGPRQSISEVAIVGSPKVDPPSETAPGQDEDSWLRQTLNVGAGDPLRLNHLTLAALKLEQGLRERGFLDVRVQPVVGTAPASQPFQVPVTFEVEAGPRYELQEIRFEGLDSTRRAWAESLADVETGKVLRERDIAEARRRFLATGLFSSVFVETDPGADGGATLRLGVRERSRFTLGYGLRFESDEGLGAVVDFLDRNLAGRGITLGVRGLDTGSERLGRVYTVIPRPFGKRFSVESFAQVRTETSDGLITDSLEAALQLSFPLRRYTTARIYGRYLDERVREEEPDFFFPIDDRTVNPLVGVQLLYDTRQGPGRGDRGLFASVDLSGSDELLGSDFRYLRLFGQIGRVRAVGRIGSRRLTWAQFYRVGLAKPFRTGPRTLFDEEPFLLSSARFLAGGEFSVRGYPTESLGPADVLGDIQVVQGGEALLVVNQELRFPVAKRLSGVLFFDAGNVWPSLDDFASDLARSVGFGLRAETPLGLLRVDLAHPLDPRANDPEIKVYVGFGQVF